MNEKQKSQDDYRVFGLKTWKNGIVIYWDSKGYKEGILGGEGIKNIVLGI